MRRQFALLGLCAFLSLGLLLVACGDDSGGTSDDRDEQSDSTGDEETSDDSDTETDEEPGADEGTDESTGTEADTDPDQPTGPEGGAPPPQDPLALITGDKPEMPALFAEHGLKLGIPFEEAVAAGVRGGKAWGNKELEGYPVRTTVGYMADSMGSPGIKGLALGFKIPPDDVLPVLTERWGEPQMTVEKKYTPWGKVVVWLNPEARVRASLQAGQYGQQYSDVIYDRYTPVTGFLGDDPKKLAFETTHLIGLTGQQVRETYPANLVPGFEWEGKGPSRIDVQPTEYQLKPVQVFLFYDRESGLLYQYSVKLDIQSAESARPETLKAIEARYGEPVETPEGKPAVYQTAPYRVEVDTQGNPKEVILSVIHKP